MYPKTDRTTPRRLRDRVGYRRDDAVAVLDEALYCAVGFVADGAPRVLPTLHARIGDTLYLHGSTGSGPMLAARGGGLPVCVVATLLDGLVYARSQFNHSANYRSVVAYGTARPVTDETEKRAALAALVERTGVGRSADSRPPNRRELAETMVLALPLDEVSVKVRRGGVADDPADLGLPYWAGVVPIRSSAGAPEPDAGVAGPPPDYLRPARSAWWEPVRLAGDRVVLEPLSPAHVDELYAATDDEEVWRHLGPPRPRDRDDLAGLVEAALAAQHRGERVPWVQRCAVTGRVIGTTSWYEIDEERRSVAIGYTWLGRPWWRTGVNTEAKLLLLTRAFERLGAVRVVWHTDIRNERSQRAIERLGARREGVLRMHRQRWDGSWRDTVQYSMVADEWPAVRDRLAASLTAPR
ncbi:MAG TPA: bifunctional pyridoxamine 5'-phosphate oxidase family protein/GNAT family N-acetyltransferase [Micromonospora sp.]